MSIIKFTWQKQNSQSTQTSDTTKSSYKYGRQMDCLSNMQSPAISLLVLAAAVQPLSAQLNTSYVVDVIRRLNEVYRFRTFPIFTQPVNRFRDLPEKLAQQCQVPQIVICEDSSQKVKDIVDKNALSIVLTEYLSGKILNTAVDQLRGMHQCKAIFVITTPVALQRQSYFLKYLWQAQFVNVLVFFDDLDSNTAQIFSMDPFPELKWMNQTSLTNVSKLFMKRTDNWMGHKVEVPFTEDAPRVFPFKKNGVTSMVGRHAIIIALFAKHMNITLIPKYKIDLDLAKLLLEFHSQKMDFSVHSFSKRDLQGMGATYPMESVRWCVMVPLRSEVPKSKYVVIAFDRATWLVACISIVYVALLLRYIDPPPERSQKRYFLRSFALLVYSPNMAERMYSPSIRQFAFFTLVFLLGFILSCIYSTYLTSYCTNMVFQPPIDSVKDLQKENLRVMVIDYELESIRKSQTLGKDFLELLYPVSYFEMLKYRNNFNGCYAYTIRQDRWRFLDKQQRGLKKKFFRLSEICFGRQYVVFPLPHDSCLEESLNQFILYIKQAGLDLFWEEEAFRMAVAMKYSTILVEQTVIIQQLQLDYFQYVFAAFAFGVVLSLVCFIVELTNKKIMDLKRDMQRIRIDRQ